MVLTGHHLVAFKHDIGDFTVLGVPELFTVCRIHTSIAVIVIFTYGVAHHVFESGSGVYIFGNAVVQLGNLVLVVGYIRIDIERKVAGPYDGSVSTEFQSPVHEGAHVLPVAALACNRVRLRHIHEHVSRLLVVEGNFKVQPVPEAESKSEVGHP